MPILKIPHDFIDLARKDPREFARNFCNVPSGTISPFFHDIAKVLSFTDYSLKNPFNSETMQFDPKWECKDDFYRYLHLDIGIKNNAFGVSMCHVPGFISKNIKEGGLDTTLILPIVKFDFLGKVFAPEGGELFLPDIRNLIIYEISKRGFLIRLITADRFSSMEILQVLKADGYVCGQLSLDRTTSMLFVDYKKDDKIRRETTDGKFTAAWDAFKEVINDSRICFPYHPAFETEVKHAERKVKSNQVHIISSSAGLSLDLLESMAGSVFNAINNEKDTVYREQDIVSEQDKKQAKFYDQFNQNPFSFEGREDSFYGELQGDDFQWNF